MEPPKEKDVRYDYSLSLKVIEAKQLGIPEKSSTRSFR